MVKPSLRTKSVGTKVSEEEYAQLEALAGDKTVGEWVYEVLLKQIGEGPKPPAEGVLLAEVLAMRTILLNVLFKLVNGEAITAQEMQQLIDRADADKLKKALERLEAAKPQR